MKEGTPMTEKLPVVRDPVECAEATRAAETALLRELVAQIRRDSAEDSKTYLDETTVPHGGE
jgi:hypothetical protein